MKLGFKHTMRACYIGSMTQAITNNLAPLLFLTFQRIYHISLEQIGFLVTVNFGIQLLVDLLAVKYVNRIGYRISMVGAHIFSALGLAGLGTLPGLFSDPYAGLITAVAIYAVGGGLLEVLVSPIVEACPTEEKSAAMSLLHSFYCWGHMAVVLLSTLYFSVIGINHWMGLTFIWAVLPAFNAVFFAFVPINLLIDHEKELPVRKLFSMKIFWVFAIIMVCAGAAEQAMSQWASAFAEMGLFVSKTMGDLLGPCLFAGLMGISRIFYSKLSAKIDLKKYILYSGILCIFSYLLAALSKVPVISLLGCALTGLSVGILWPGAFSLASAKCPAGGTALFAFLALAGDLGCTTGPTLVGIVSETAGNNLKAGLLSAIVFPILLIFMLVLLVKKYKT